MASKRAVTYYVIGLKPFRRKTAALLNGTRWAKHVPSSTSNPEAMHSGRFAFASEEINSFACLRESFLRDILYYSHCLYKMICFYAWWLVNFKSFTKSRLLIIFPYWWSIVIKALVFFRIKQYLIIQPMQKIWIDNFLLTQIHLLIQACHLLGDSFAV